MKFKFKEGEELVQQIYPSYAAFTMRFLLAFVLASTSFFFLFWLLSQDTWGLITLGSSIALAVMLVISAFRKRNADVIIITNQRIVDVEKKSAFNKEVSELTYDMIEDVTVKQKGVMSTLCRFGTLVIIGKHGTMHLELAHVRNPKDVQSLILELRQEMMRVSKERPKLEAHERLIHIVHELKYLSRGELKRLKQSVDGRIEHYKKKKKKREASSKKSSSEDDKTSEE